MQLSHCEYLGTSFAKLQNSHMHESLSGIIKYGANIEALELDRKFLGFFFEQLQFIQLFSFYAPTTHLTWTLNATTTTTHFLP